MFRFSPMVAVLLCVTPCMGVAQVRGSVWYDSSASSVIAMVGKGASPGWLIPMMRQADRPQSVAKLNAVADYLADRIIGESVKPDGDYEAMGLSRVFAILQGAGRVADHNGAPLPGTPYAGAVDRFIRIARDGTGTVKVLAMASMLSVPGRERAIAYLRNAATGSDRFALTAIETLVGEMKNGGPSRTPVARRADVRDALRELYLSRRVTEQGACNVLYMIARENNWKRTEGREGC